MRVFTPSGQEASDPPPGLPLLCFPYAGGSARIFRPWRDVLPRALSPIPVELPGRGTRISEPLETDHDSLVEGLADAVALLVDGPFAMFGHSMGAVVAFEVARRVRARSGVEPVHLFASAYRAPHLPNRMKPLYNLPVDAFLRELRKFNGTPEEVLNDSEVMDVMLPILRADFSVTDTYRCSEDRPFSCPITVFGGAWDDTVMMGELAAWRIHTTERALVKLLPGDHFFLNTSFPLLGREMVTELSPQLLNVEHCRGQS